MARRGVYAFVMVAVYVIATVLSSMSLLLCDHHHPHHHNIESHCACHSAECAGHGPIIESDCCTHHHPILGDNHTDYISSLHRSDSRASNALALMLAPAVTVVVAGEISEPYVASPITYRSDDVEPLSAAYISSAGLRAPPVLA